MSSIKKVKSVTEFMNLAIRNTESDIKYALKNFMIEAKKQLYDFTNAWYKAKPEGTYQRTYEFLESITISSPEYHNGRWEMGLFFDPKKMTLGNNNGWSQHIDRFNLSEIIEHGWEYRTDGSEAMFKTAEWAEIRGFSQELVKFLEKKGYNIK